MKPSYPPHAARFTLYDCTELPLKIGQSKTTPHHHHEGSSSIRSVEFCVYSRYAATAGAVSPSRSDLSQAQQVPSFLIIAGTHTRQDDDDAGKEPVFAEVRILRGIFIFIAAINETPTLGRVCLGVSRANPGLAAGNPLSIQLSTPFECHRVLACK